LVEADPAQIATFVRNLIKRDGGKLAAYYHALAVLPLQNQLFFTRTTSRLARFYKVFPFYNEKVLKEGVYLRKDDQFARLAREIPLDADGNVRFPGSDRVWMVAGRGSENVADLPKLLQRAGRITPDAEDEILLDMLEREYRNDLHVRFRRIQNFLTVVGIDAHRRQPMDETMALALAQNYAKYESIYPYFAEFTELTSSQALSFFQAARRLESLETNEIDTGIGELHSLLKLVSLLNERGIISDAKAAELFSTVCNNFASIRNAYDLGSVSFDSVEKILHEIRGADGKDADEQLYLAFAGPDISKEFTTQGTSRSVNPGAVNRRRMREVLRLQAIVPLEVLLQTYRAALRMTRGIDANAISQIEKNLPSIVEIVPSDRDKLDGFVEDVLIGRPSQLASLVQTLKKRQASEKAAPKNVAKAANDLISELNPFLKTTLVGWIDAYYLSPSDLAVASNRYFVRSHIFSELTTKDYWPKARLQSSPIGSRFIGGFAQIGLALSEVAASALDASGSVSPYHTAAIQLAAVRSVPWSVVDTRSIHLAALRVRLGREFIVQAGFSDSLKSVLETATVGVLGLARRREVLSAVSNRDVGHAMSLLTSSDLFFLADAFIQTSVVDRERSAPLLSAYNGQLRRVPLDQINYFGGIHTETAGCSHSHLIHAAPYEDFAERPGPLPLAERMSDILLEVVESLDRADLPVEAVSLLGERAVRQFFAETRNTPREDWLSAAQAMSTMDMSTFVDALEDR
jgi:hypothetical protein